MSLLPPGWRIRLDGSGSGCAIPKGRSGRQTKSGASRSGRVEGFVVGEHVPDRPGQAAGDLDLRDLGAALSTEPLFGALVALCVGGVAERVHGRLKQRPAQIARSVL